MIESKYIKDFENWCEREYIRLKPNSEIFFINSRKTIVPRYRTGTNVYIHIADSFQATDAPMYQSFAKSFHTIIVIPKDIIVDLVKNVTKKDIALHFKINL